jgi:hypothetical protein
MAVNNALSLKTIDEWIKDIQATSGAVAKMPEQLVPVVQAQCDLTVAAGQSLDGRVWAPLVRGGGKALQTVKVAVYASGRIIWLTLTGGAAIAQFGTHKEVARPILPSKGLPDKLGNAIRTGLIEFGLPFMQRKGGHKGKSSTPWGKATMKGGS